MSKIIAVETELETPSLPVVENVERYTGPPSLYQNQGERFANLLSYEPVGRWLRKRQPRTKDEYLRNFEHFLSWTKTRISVATPIELLAWAKSQDGTIVQDLIDEYTENESVSKVQVKTAAVRSFLGRNGYRDLPKIDWSSTMNPDREGYKRSEIIAMLGYLDSPFQKLYVQTAKDTGLRANDLLALTYGQVKQDLEEGQKFVHVHFPKEAYQRRKAPGRTFMGPNSLDILRALIAEGKIKTKAEARIFPFVYPTITGSLKWAAKRAKLRPEIQPSHGLRKFFESCLDRVGMDHHKKNQISGHSNGVLKAYTSKDIDELRELYGQAYKYLDLTEEGAISGEVGVLQKTVQDQAATISELKAELAEMKQIRKELDALKRKVG